MDFSEETGQIWQVNFLLGELASKNTIVPLEIDKYQNTKWQMTSKRGFTLVGIVWLALLGNTCIMKYISVKLILQVRIIAVVWCRDAVADDIWIKWGSANYICHQFKWCPRKKKQKQKQNMVVQIFNISLQGHYRMRLYFKSYLLHRPWDFVNTSSCAVLG